MNAVLRHRRHPLALVVLLLGALLVAGMAYAAVSPTGAQASEATGVDDIALGEELFLANCSTCHGTDGAGGYVNADGQAAGPSLIGVGAASVDFQVGTGRMPAQASGPQIAKREPQFTLEETRAMAAYVASEFGPGPAIPDGEFLDPANGDVAEGSELFRVNCAMCHNFAGSGGALTRGKYAPNLRGVEPVHVYEAMVTGPQSMPVFSDDTLTPQQKNDIITFLDYVENEPSPGGLSLGSLGPVGDGLFVWVVGITGLIACAVWLGAKSS
ncbi:cytochrome bc1 complex diheme cytochrome c subunit [Aquipuribacter sp. MA13-6]|uniref:cytochrome bc1 complex diheme cytochrome c subunit n=1 Tax=unclassified Aquipuribacter TaxID=2635084 RepID=UPI003EEFB028